MKLTLLSFCLFVLALASSCNKNHDDNELPSLPGTWQEEEMPLQFAGTTYRITFHEDKTFALRWTVFTDAIDPQNPCRYDGVKYIRGRYVVDGSELRLSGRFCDSSYTLESPDCYYGVEFSRHHTLSGRNGLLILDNERGDYSRMTLRRE